MGEFYLKALILLIVVLLAGCSVAEPQQTQDQIKITQEPMIAQEPQQRSIEMRITENSIEPAEITVNQGDTITLSISSLNTGDKPMRFVIEDNGIDVLLHEGGPTIVTFTATKKGSFSYGDFKGINRRGLLIVE